MSVLEQVIVTGVLGTGLFAIRRRMQPAQPIALQDGLGAPVPKKVQHAVFYVSDLDRSRKFYQHIFALQFSARNHQDSSAAMRLAGQNMNFFSFGIMHHDVCLVLNPSVRVDNDQWLGFTVSLRSGESLDSIRQRLNELCVTFSEGRVLPVPDDSRAALFFRDPDGHVIEVVEGKEEAAYG